MKKISAVVSAYNEEDKIESCLKSLSWCDEIILIDNESQDRTAEIAKKLGAVVLKRPNNPMLNLNKNFGFEKAKNEWILNLDADEQVSKDLEKEIEKIPQNITLAAFKIPRQNIIFGKWIKHSLWWPDYQIRLFKKGSAKFSCQHVHELLSVNGEVGILENFLIHHNYHTVSQFVQKMDKIYTDNEAQYMLIQGKELTWKDALWLPANDFFKTFFLQKGYRDGLHGLVLSLLQTFYALVVFAKYWELKKFNLEEPKNFPEAVNAELKKVTRHLFYWIRTSEIESTKSPVKRWVLRTKRKFRL